MGDWGNPQQFILQAGALCGKNDIRVKVQKSLLFCCRYDEGYRKRFKQLLHGDTGYARVSYRWSFVVSSLKLILYVLVLHISFCRDYTKSHILFYVMASKVDSKTVTLGSSIRMARLCLSMNAVPRKTSIANFSTTLNSTVVSKSAVLRCTVLSSLTLNRSFDADKSDCCTFLDIFDKQWVATKLLK